MTTAKELRAAAEMILALMQADVSGEPAEATRERLFPGMSADAALAKAEAGIVGMCSHILATIREDDDEPTGEYVGSKRARTRDEWHEDYGFVLWWILPVCEPPYVGCPLCDDWPGYHTHWTPIPLPATP